MPLIIPSGYFEVSFHMSGPRDHVNVCTSGFQYIGATFETDAALLSQYWMQALGGEMSNQYIHFLTRFRVAAGTLYEVSESTAGSKTGAALPPNNTWLVTKITGNPGRRNKGRLFLPPPLEGDVDPAGTISSGIVSDMQDALDAFLAASATADWLPVILHNSTPSTPANVDSWRAESTIATQRRRLR